MTTATSSPRPTYGNWIKHRSPGLLGAGTLGTAVLIGTVVAGIIGAVAAGILGAVILAGLGVLAFIGVGTPAGTLAVRRATYAQQRSNREHQYRSGAFAKHPKAREVRLPGTLARTSVSTHSTPYGAAFGVVKTPASGDLYTVTARCHAEGLALQDQRTVDGWVAEFGRLLAGASQDPALIAVKAVVDTAPDHGGRLEARVRAARSSNSPQVARTVMDECVATYPAASAECVTYIEATYQGTRLSRKGDEGTRVAELARRVPVLVSQLKTAGAGAVDMLTGEDLAGVLRVAYDPAAAPRIEADHLAGTGLPVEWEDAGPVATQEAWDRLTHDSGVSVTWEMAGAPRAPVTERALAALLEPHEHCLRKRVAVVYRPHDPDKGLQLAERDLNTARFQAKSRAGGHAQAMDSLHVEATDQTRREVASGAALTRFSVLVTATVALGGDLEQAVSTVESRAGAVPIRLRRCYGSQAAGFAATIPVGFLPWLHTAVSDTVRELV
jgi:hypothetical protein